MARSLGDFEQFVLYALVALKDEAYGAAIHREIQDRTGRSILIGGVYTVLDRLESRGLVESWIGAPTGERGGRRRKYYRLTSGGLVTLRNAHEAFRSMSRGVERLLARMDGDL